MIIFRAVVRVTPTQDAGKILQSLHGVEAEGEIDLVRAVQVAQVGKLALSAWQLALKHRIYKNQRQRIVLFVGSPVVCVAQPRRSAKF